MENMMFTDNLYQPVSDAYDGKSIFVTGSSGFLGKIFVEKLLYRCPKIARIYVLLRDTLKTSADEKLKKMLESPIFKRLKEERPKDFGKIIPIMGDISKLKLGINAEDENMLIENVSMVFHFAATIKFNDPVHVTLNVNVEGTKRVLELCTKLKKLQIFIYVSTAFSNSNRMVIDEVVYPSVMPLEDIDKVMKQTFTARQMERLLNGMPNMYTMSKNLAESVVVEFQKKHSFPMVIVRPSIVISCKDEPLSGWIDNWFGPTSLLLAISTGVAKALLGDRNNIIDLIPVDYVSNVVIVAGARCRRANNLEIYNSSSSGVNPITLQRFTNFVKADLDKKIADYGPAPKIMYIKWKWLLTILTFFMETVPAYLADCASYIFGNKNIYLKMVTRMQRVRDAINPFTSRTWMMKSHNTSALANTLSPQDRKFFACDASSINWNDYIPLYLRGVQKYLLDLKH